MHVTYKIIEPNDVLKKQWKNLLGKQIKFEIIKVSETYAACKETLDNPRGSNVTCDISCHSKSLE